MESEWLQAIITPALSTSIITVPGLSAVLGVAARLPDRRRMIAWQVGAVEATVVALVVLAAGIGAGGAAATGGWPGAGAAAAAGGVEACARGNATRAASTLTAISNRVVRRESDPVGGDRDGMTVQARASKLRLLGHGTGALFRPVTARRART